jgi:hypothetical protein
MQQKMDLTTAAMKQTGKPPADAKNLKPEAA